LLTVFSQNPDDFRGFASTDTDRLSGVFIPAGRLQVFVSVASYTRDSFA
jgi:hypothetical protein